MLCDNQPEAQHWRQTDVDAPWKTKKSLHSVHFLEIHMLFSTPLKPVYANWIVIVFNMQTALKRSSDFFLFIFYFKRWCIKKMFHIKLFTQDYRNRCLTFYFKGGCSRCRCCYHVLTTLLPLTHTGRSDKRALYSSFSRTAVSCAEKKGKTTGNKSRKALHSWHALSCWAKWGLVMGHKCTAGGVKLCEERFGWEFCGETKSTSLLSFASWLILC